MEQNPLENTQKWIPKPAETFGIDFGNARNLEITSKMLDLGFRFTRTTVESDENVIVYHGERTNGDGTTITVRIEKGSKYKSPMELAYEENEKRK
jgi:hypothetical protein